MRASRDVQSNSGEMTSIGLGSGGRWCGEVGEETAAAPPLAFISEISLTAVCRMETLSGSAHPVSALISCMLALIFRVLSRSARLWYSFFEVLKLEVGFTASARSGALLRRLFVRPLRLLFAPLDALLSTESLESERRLAASMPVNEPTADPDAAAAPSRDGSDSVPSSTGSDLRLGGQKGVGFGTGEALDAAGSDGYEQRVRVRPRSRRSLDVDARRCRRSARARRIGVNAHRSAVDVFKFIGGPRARGRLYHHAV